MTKNTKISKENSAQLARAYMNLYKILVRTYQQKNKTNGQSWYNAVNDMNKILMIHKDEQKKDPVIEFLFELLKSHKKVVAKKCMQSLNRDNIVSVKNNCTDNLQTAILKFEHAIQNIKLQNNGLHAKTKATNVVPTYPHITRSSFYDWLEKSVDITDIEKLEADPRQFEILYNKYIKQQKHR